MIEIRNILSKLRVSSFLLNGSINSFVPQLYVKIIFLHYFIIHILSIIIIIITYSIGSIRSRKNSNPLIKITHRTRKYLKQETHRMRLDISEC